MDFTVPDGVTRDHILRSVNVEVTLLLKAYWGLLNGFENDQISDQILVEGPIDKG